MAEPKIRFEEFSKSWKQYKIGEISDRVIVGLATSVTPYYRKEGVPIFRNLNIKDNFLDDSNILYLDKFYADSQVSKQIHAGDVLTVHTGYIGTSCVVPEKYDKCLTFTTLITTPDKNILIGKFLSQYLNSEIGMKAVQEVTTQGGRQNLNTNDFVNVKITIPCLEEQQKIADFLFSVDEVIATSEQEVANLEIQKKAVMKKIFSQEVRFKKDDGSNFPEWENTILSQCVNVIMGQSPESKSVNSVGEGEFLIQGKADLHGFGIVPDRCTNKPTKICNSTDLIMTVRAPVGFVTEIGFRACIGRGVCALRANNKTFEKYIKFFLESIENNWRKIEQGSTFTAINSDVIEMLPINLPCLDEQQKIAELFSNFDEAIASAKKELEFWKELKKGLLQQMFV